MTDTREPKAAAPGCIALSDATLSRLASSIARPSYDRSRLEPRLVHIGAGAFNRSHLAVYLDDLLARPENHLDDEPRWAELAVGLLPADQAIHASLAAQDHLYSLMLMDTGTESLRIVGPLAGHLYAPADPEAVLHRMTAAECAIISLTVTEGGYFIEDTSGRFIADHADIRHDLQNPAAPRTWLGYVAEAAARRMQMGRGPFTLLSCDNLHANGVIARKALLAFAAMRSQVLECWIAEHVAFPCSMVDRITPRTMTRIAPPLRRSSACWIACRWSRSPSGNGFSKTASPRRGRPSSVWARR